MKEGRFKSLWDRCANSNAADRGAEIYGQLKAHYMEPHRRYHTPVHIAHCLNQFDLARGQMDEPDAVEMAIWFHDVIYDAKAADNELKSAELFTELSGSDVSAEFNSKVRDLILVTIHRHLPETRDEKFVVDIDLSSFGLPWDRFLKDSDGVRDEFPHLSDQEFYPVQKIFLDSLLSRKTFCFTKFFRDRHEDTARDNISKYIDKLKQRGLIEN